MPSTTVHLPDDLLLRIDRLVQEKGISRNRFITEACREALENSAGQWPIDFFDSDLTDSQLSLLREGAAEMDSAIFRLRRNRPGVEF